MTPVRKALPAIGMTAAGVIMLLRFQTNPGGRPIGALGVGTSSTGARAGAGNAGAGARTTVPSLGNGVTTTTPGGTSSTGTLTGVANGTFAGSSVDTQYGPVQVQITISGGAITDVQELQVPDSHERSVAINDEAGPILRSEVLQAQSAQIDQLSGATITWEAYSQSLQAAIDAAHK